MTIECIGYFDRNRNIHVADRQKLEPLRKVHGEGEACRVIFTDEIEGAHEKAFKAFHVYRDQYANAQGLDKEEAKALLKMKYGVTVPYVEGFKPPVDWGRGRFAEVEGRIYYMKSSTTYTMEELTVLIQGTITEING